MKYKVAVATSDGKTVDSHFGHASAFVIYEVEETDGSFTDIEEREVRAACSGGECGAQTQEAEGGCASGGGCSNPVTQAPSPMDLIAQQLSDVDYVLVARIGPHAIRALAKYNVSAYDIVLPIDEAIAKINGYRKKITERKLRLSETAH